MFSFHSLYIAGGSAQSHPHSGPQADGATTVCSIVSCSTREKGRPLEGLKLAIGALLYK